jgi:hypothetical protein
MPDGVSHVHLLQRGTSSAVILALKQLILIPLSSTREPA